MRCVLITGIPAAGKSTLAGYLGEQLNLPVLSKDRVKELLYDTVGFRSRAEKVRLGTAAMEIMYYAAEQLMFCGRQFIMENNFENVSRKGLLDILDRHDCQALTVTLTGDYQIIYHRFLARNQSLDRHRGHIVNTQYPEITPSASPAEITFADFTAGIAARGMDTFSANGPHIVADTSDFDQFDRRALLESVREFLRS